MGLIQAAIGSVSGSLADQWKEFFTCDALPADVLMRKGARQVGKRSSNTRGSDNVISDGSGIAVADGQCMMIVEQGKVVEVCAEPGVFTYRTDLAPSLFTGKFGESLKATFKDIGARFTMGGATGKDQRVYYFNTKELVDNKFGTANPIPFRVVDHRIGLDIDVSLRMNGVYSYAISDPILFYTNVCGNVTEEYTRDELDSQLKTEFISALQPAFARLSDMEIRPNQIIAHTSELEQAMNASLSEKWGKLRGLQVVSVALGSVTLPEEDQQLIKDAQRAAMYKDPTMAAANLAGAQADAMRKAAENTAGAMTGFMGMGMAMNAGGGAGNLQNLYAMGQQQSATAESNSWRCSCGATATGKFCPECGSPKPAAGGWTCSCGAVNQGKFCQSCGSPKPKGAPLYRCDKCGWVPEDPTKPPKFCPECGDVFDDSDKQ